MPSRIITSGVVGGADRPDHALARRFPPEGTHAFTGVAAPALDEGMGGKNPAVDLLKLGFMQACLGTAVDLVAIVEHETGTV